MKEGAVYKYDLSLPVEKMYNLVEEMRTRIGKTLFVMATCSLKYCFLSCFGGQMYPL
jgi:predicted DNA-binding protein (UPF0278 family)